MNCEDVIAQLIASEDDALSVLEHSKIVEHLADCGDCQDGLRGANVLRMVRSRTLETAPEGLFERMLDVTTAPARPVAGRSQFWAGAAVGGLLAAGIAIAVVTLGLFRAPEIGEGSIPIVTMTLGVQQDVNIAIDAEKDLPGTTVNVFLAGGIELVGFGDTRELSWSTDLEKGVNRLALPLLAIDGSGGHLVVRLQHEGTERIFRVDLKSSG